MGLPRTARKMRGHSPPCSGDSAASMGASSFTSTCQAVSVDSPEKNGRSPAVHSPQPVSPSDWTSASTILRLRVTPKLVSNGRTSGICSSRRIIASILIRFCIPLKNRNQGSIPRQRGPSSKTPFPSASREKPSTASPRENACLKLLSILQLNSERLVRGLLRWPSIGRWRPEPECVLRIA